MGLHCTRRHRSTGLLGQYLRPAIDILFDGSSILQVSTLHTKHNTNTHTQSFLKLGYQRESSDVGSELSGNQLRYQFEVR